MFFSYNIAVLVMGFISGMTLLLSGNTMNFWLTAAHIDKTSIGIFALISIPYAVSFIWSPILDHVKVPFLHRFFGLRFSWIICIQILLSFAVLELSKVTPNDNIMQFAAIGLVIAFLSSTQDIALGALKAEIIPRDAIGSSAGVYIFGYRIGMLVGSSGAIYASVYMSWGEIYKIFAGIILYFPIVLYLVTYKISMESQNELETKEEGLSKYISLSFWRDALKNIGSKKVVMTILIFLILYRLPDNFISMMINPFLVETGFDALQISTVGKFLGILTAIIGGMIAGFVMKKIKIIDAVLYFGIIHALSHLFFIMQNNLGNNIYSLFIVIGVESITGGMVMASYIAFITSLCSGKYLATQYAFLSSMMGISRSIFPSISGVIVTMLGWNNFFFLITIITIPSILILIKLRKMLGR
jgi:PAT family beta-lactamase induction signal transducer AmpG